VQFNPAPSHPSGVPTLIRWILLAAIACLGFTPGCERRVAQDGDSSRVDSAREGTDLHPAPAVSWTQPRSDEGKAERLEMVARQIEARGVKDPVVLEAMRQVPRHWFVPADFRSSAYSDQPLPIGAGQTISQPYIVAFMTESLQLTSDSKVLEIGTGSGYQAAVLSEITPHVFTIEIIEPLARRASATFERHGYQTIKTRIGDGYAGWAEHAPFDTIIVTCAPDHIPPKLIEQLKPGGRICIPVGGEHNIQRLVVATLSQEGTLNREELTFVRFVPMTGAARDQAPGG